MDYRADLNPPLGNPGGPCFVVKRILDHVSSPASAEVLIQKVEQGREFEKTDERAVYRPLQEKGPGGSIEKMLLSPHVQYKMDLRGVPVYAVRKALKSALKQLETWQAKGDRRYNDALTLLRRENRLKWHDTESGLFISVAPNGMKSVEVVTTFWKGVEDPPAPGKCPRTGGYRTDDLSGYQTFVKGPGTGDRKEQALPSPPWSRSKPTGTPSYNGPDSDSDIKPRTTGVPGRPHPDAPAQSSPKREPVQTAAVKGPAFPGSDRQKDQKGESKVYYQVYYQKNRKEIQNRAKRWNRKYKNTTRYKNDKMRRRKYPDRFTRRPSGGHHQPKDRSKEWRKDQKKASFEFAPVPFFHWPTKLWAEVVDLDADHGLLIIDDENHHVEAVPLEEFFNQALFEDEDLDAMLEILDMVYGDVTTANLIERVPPEMDPGTWVDRATPQDPHDHPGLNKLDIPEVTDNPGSARVIPEGRGFENRKAVRIKQIVDACDTGLRQKARGIKPRLSRVDAKNAMWTFTVQGSGDTYLVKVKAQAKGNVRDAAKADVHVACSCPFWQWQGPEHWAQKEGYLFGKPKGTASVPSDKDPAHRHGACKHVLAVFDFILDKKWGVPGKAASTDLRFLADTLASNEVVVSHPEAEASLHRVAAWYLGAVRRT